MDAQPASQDLQSPNSQSAQPQATVPVAAGGHKDPEAGNYFRHIPHPHISHRRDEGPIKVKDQLPKQNPLARLNSRIAIIITVAVGSMWCAYIFTLIALVSLPSALATGDKIIIVGWVAQTFIQLVLLPVIIVGQNLQGAASDKRAEQTYNDAEAVLHEAIQIQQHLTAQDQHLQEQDQRLQDIVNALMKAYPNLQSELQTGPAASPGPAVS